MKAKVWIHSVLVALIAITVVLPLSCRKDEDNLPNPAENKQVEKVITAASGGTLTTSDSVKLIIPPYALPMDGKVFIGRTGNEPTSVPNKNLRIEGEPITMRLPSNSILKPIQLSFPRPSGSIDTSNYFVFLFNGSTYFPMEYSLTGTKVIVSIDKINWEMSDKKGVISEIIIIGLIIKQTPLPWEMGLKKVSIRSGTMYFESPTANSSSKVLLLVHGWTGSPSTWEEFLPWIMTETNPSYSEYWTFGYNSSWSINHNGELLANLVKTHANGAQIDIVAHSMGGLVSRSMIEKYKGAPYIRKLVTLGTPHEGSPLAVFRYVLGDLVAMKNPIEIYIYNYFTQGFKDLNTDSKFIVEMEKLSNPPIPLRYYTIASTNDPSQNIFSNYVSQNLLPGLDDGIVTVSSAHGVSGAVSPETDVNIPVAWAHLHMKENSTIHEQVLSFLRAGSLVGTIIDVDGNVYKTVTIGTQVWMAENLKTTKYRNGVSIPNVTDNTQWSNLTTGAYCNYNNDINYVNIYGRLYNWHAVSDSRNIAPVGWHVSTDAEWTTLTNYLGGENVAGGKLKETGTTHWNSPNTGATNETGFTALPSGNRFNFGTFSNDRYSGYWWSATEYDATSAWYRDLYFFTSPVYRDYSYKKSGLSIRCLKD